MKKLLLIVGVVLLNYNSMAQCANANNIYSFTVNGTNYELVRENRTWAQAAACAVSRGGFLAHIENIVENTAIFNALSSPAAGINLTRTTAPDGGGGSYVWLGGNDIRTEGTWIWNGTNSPFVGVNSEFWRGAFNSKPIPGRYQNWGIGDRGSQSEPDNSQNQDALGLALTQWPVGFQFWLGTASQWNDIDASNTLYYLIEFTPCVETTNTIDETSCGEYSSPSGKVWRSSGTYNDTIPNAEGCDSVITVNLTIKPNSSSLEKISACDSLETPNGGFWTETGTYIHTTPNAIGCDSIIIYELTVSKTSYASVYESTCNSYTSPSGKLWTLSGQYNDTIPNSAGCDSVITVDLTVLSETQSSITETVCNSYTSPSGKLWTISGTYNDTIPNAAGCDSMITIDLTVSSETQSSITETVCNSYTAPSGKLWTISGTYNDTIPNAAGCDSVITVNLTILSNTQSTSNVNSCSAFTSPSGKIWSISGSYNDTIPNVAGCDSVMTFNLTIISVDNQVTKTKDTLSAATGDTYQWLDCEDNYAVISGATDQTFIPTNDGEYAVEVTKTGCVDTSDCVLVELSSIGDINDNRVKIYPNPTTDHIQIKVQEGMPVESIKVYDVLGKEFEITYTKSQNMFKISLGELPSGNYMIVIQSQENQIRRQVQKM